jgi:membrane metallo-endopeptidase-like protein 1
LKINFFQLDQAWLSLPREYLVKGLDNEVVKAYFSYMVDVAVILGADRDRATDELRESLDFEISLANVSAFFIVRSSNFETH